MSKGSAPSAPDPWQSAAAQYQYGTEAASYNAGLGHTNQITPYGSTTWSEGAPGSSVSPSYTNGGGGVSVPGYPGASSGVPQPPTTNTQPTPTFGLGGSGIPMQIQAQPAYGGSNAITGVQYGNNAPEYFGTGGTDAAPGGTSTPPIYTQSETLSPAQQELFNTQQGNQISSAMTAGNFAGEAAQASRNPVNLQTSVAPTPVQSQINTSGVPGIAGAGNLGGFTNEAQNAAYQQQTQYLNPQFSQEKEQLQSQLTNEGAQPGDAAWTNAMTLFDNQQQQAYESASNNAVSQGLTEQQALYGESANTNQQLFGEAATGGQFANSAAGQEFGQELSGANFGNSAAIQQQELPIQEYLSLEGQTGAGGTPSFGLGGAGGGGGGGVQAPDIMSAFQQQYAGQLAGYNANVASTNSDVGAAASLAALYLLA
jgi:hypothetical protein